MPTILSNDETTAYSPERLVASLSNGSDSKSVIGDFVHQEVERLLPETITVDKFVDIVSRTLVAKSIEDPLYDRLGVYLMLNRHQNTTFATFSACIAACHTHTYMGEPNPLVADHVFQAVQANAATLDRAIRKERDFDLTFFSYMTLKRSYLMKSKEGVVWETPQYMWMRVACGIHARLDGTLDLDRTLKTYESMSQLLFTHATPTMFNAGTPRPQMSSCYLLQIQADSIEGIFDTLKMTAQISKYAGGIGLSIDNVRAKGSRIRGTNGTSNGILPMLRVFNNAARYVDQGGGRRKGSIAMYLSPWHPDIFEFLDIRLITGKEEARARDLFTALWIDNVFMERLTSHQKYSLFDPDECPGLSDAHGETFKLLYERYESEGKARRTVDPNEIWAAMIRSQVETGTPYVLFKDWCNAFSNQQHLGTLKCSNLCTEILEYVSPEEVAVCNLASISLHRFVDADSRTFDFSQFRAIAKQAVYNLNQVIDKNFYPLPEAKYSNLRHRPIGVGVQGLADALIQLKINYDSQEGVAFNEKVFEHLYFACMEASWEEAVRRGAPYETFPGSPLSKGIFQFDLQGKTEDVYTKGSIGKEKWEALKAKVRQDGCANSLLVAPMPTASTSQILGSHVESMSPMVSVLYQKRTITGDFLQCMPQFVQDMKAAGCWTPKIRNQLEQVQGNVEAIADIPVPLKRLYRSVWNMSQKFVLDHAIARSKYICQSQSMNVWMQNPDAKKVSSMLYYGWKNQLKTGMYYLRSQSKSKASQWGVDSNEVCETCSS